MEEGKLTIRPIGALAVSAGDVRILLEAGNGDAALLYLHILLNGGTLDAERAATELHRADRDIETAVGRLQRMGLLTGETGTERRIVPEPVRELPEYEARDVARPGMDSREFRDLVEAVQLSLGRILSTADLKKLFGIYDELALPAEVILLLVEHCKAECAARYGKERNVGFAFIEKEAYEWFHRELLTCEQAERWLAELERRRSALGQVRQLLGIRDRALAPTERKYLMEWIGMGFTPEAVAVAADRTVTKTGGLKWGYMNAIIQSWHKAGLHTPEEIERGDPAAGRKTRTAGEQNTPARDEKKTIAQMRRLREKINGEG